MDELRELLRAWRDAKRSAWNAVVSWAVRIGLALLVAGIAVKVGVLEMSAMQVRRLCGDLRAAGPGRRRGAGRRVRRRARALGGTVPLLWQHDPARPIGRVEYLKEDRRGLRVIGRLSAGRGGARGGGLARRRARCGD